MDYEATLNQALDLLADEEEKKAVRLLQSGIDAVKAELARGSAVDGGAGELAGYYYWGRFLEAMEEFEQALLKFEQALKIDPDHEGSLWETASILLHDLDKPDLAQRLLEDKILKLYPGNDLYREALAEARFLLRVRNSPPEAPSEAEAGDGDAGIGGDSAAPRGPLGPVGPRTDG